MFHYCSGETFIKIIQNRTIRFSDINLLNDGEEGRWGYEVFKEARQHIIQRENIPKLLPLVPDTFFERINTQWLAYGAHLSSFVACFSLDGDSLSQWRAYADDGRGFAIGFSRKTLRRLPVQILEVLYDRDQQLQEMIIALGAMFMEMDAENKQDDDNWFFERCMLLISSSVALKNPAWRDEREIRCQHVVTLDIAETVWKIAGAGGESDGTPTEALPIEFQARQGLIVPYFDMPFDVSDEYMPLVEITLGPKCPNAFATVRLLLGNSGYSAIELKNSGASYR